MSFDPVSEPSQPVTSGLSAKSSEEASSISEPPGPSTTVLRSLSDPLPAPAIIQVHPKQSATSLQTFDDAASRALFKYPRFSTATTLAETGGPGFSIEELTSTEVSEDEDAILNEPVLRRRTLSRLSLQPSTVHATPLQPNPQPDRLQKAADYIRDLLATVVHVIVNYMRPANDQDPRARDSRQDLPPRPTAQTV